jgi:hypothetical protein
MVEQNMNGLTLLNATAIFDGVSKKVYATVKSTQVPLSKDDYVVLTVSGSSVLAQVGALETSGENTIATFDFPARWFAFPLFPLSSGSELVVALTTLPKSKPMLIPYAFIDVTVANPDIILELKQKIESINGLTFSEGIASLNPSSKAGVTFNAGNPKTMMDTYVADKVKANFSKRGMVLYPGKTKGQFFTDSGSVQERLADVLWEIRHQIVLWTRDEQFVQYTLSAIDKESNVIINNQKINDVRVVKKNGKKEFKIKFNENHHDRFVLLSGECTIVIDKKNVEKSDFVQWCGVPNQFPSWLTVFADDDQGYPVYYNKKFNDDSNVYLEFPDYNRNDLLNNGKPTLLTVDRVIIFGTIKMDKDNKVVFVPPFRTELWGKKMASIKPNGYANVRPIEVGSSASVETLQLKVDLYSVNKALEISKDIWSFGDTTLAELSSVIGTLKVKDAKFSPAKPGVKVTNAAVTLEFGIVHWFNNYFEILVEDEKYMMTVCDGYGTSLDLPAPEVLKAIFSDITKTKEQTYTNLVALPLSNNRYGLDFWAVAIDEIVLTITDAEFKKTANGYKYQFYYNSLVPVPLPVFLSKAPDRAFNLLFTKKIEAAG